MKKLLFTLLCVCSVGFCGAEKLPDNYFFQAMQDELSRTMKQLKRPGLPRPFYGAYKVEELQRFPVAAASFGQLYPVTVSDAQIEAYAVLNIGSAKEDSMGYAHESYWVDYAYRLWSDEGTGKNYHALRQALWRVTDRAYIFAAEVYQQKQAYKRQKNLHQDWPDFVPGKQAHYVETLPAFTPADTEELQTWAQDLSQAGRTRAYLEQFAVEIAPQQQNVYYLNSLGGFYQWARRATRVEWKVTLRNKDGYKKQLRREIWLAEITPQTGAELAADNAAFLEELDGMYNAQKGTTYVGPVLLTPDAAGGFLGHVLVKNLQNVNPLLSAQFPSDPLAGKLRGNLGLRVLSNVADVYDRPHERTFNGKPLGGFMPVDDEGVAAQELALVTGGKLRTLPRSSRPADKKTRSNGHARMAEPSLPRERLTNVFLKAKDPVAAEQLEQQLLAKCRELELEYCYILPVFPPMTENKTTLATAQRIYTADGHKETVYGLKVSDLTPRALRDILAAGDDANVSYLRTDAEAYYQTFPAQSVVTPSLLLEELELVPDDAKADKPPFVKKP